MRTLAVYLDEEQESRKRKRRIVGGAIALIALLAVAKRERPPAPLDPLTVTVTETVAVPVPFPVIAETVGPPAPPTVIIRVEVPVERPPVIVARQPRVVVPQPPPPDPVTVVDTVQPPPERNLFIDPMSIHFGAPGWQTVTITNPNDVPVSIDDITVAGTGGSRRGYDVNDRNCRRVLQPRERCAISILASPVAVRTRAAIRIEIFHDGRTRPTTVHATTGGG